VLRIRPFSLSDLDSLLQIENLSFPKSPYDWTTFLNLYGLYSETFLVYHNTNRSWKKEKIGGYIIFTQHGHIISIAVHPQYRRKGIGTQLLQRVMKTSHLKKVWAEVRRSNQSALVFYSKMGFQMTGVIPNYYGNEDALMIQWAPAICESD
jgi:ribosomal-protein-alanine N-acetyltransferase